MSYSSLLRQRADVIRLRYNSEVDEFGQASAPSAIVVFDDVPCRLSQPILRTGAGNAERQDDSHRAIEHTHICYMKSNMLELLQQNASKVKGKDRLFIEGKIYEIEKIMPRAAHSTPHHLELAIQQIEREQDEDV